MNQKYCVLLLLVCSFTLSGCTSVFTGLYGMKKQQRIDEKDILKYSKKYGIPLTDSYELSASYDTFMLSIDTSRYAAQRKNHKQPLQVLYYDRDGHLRSFITNCYAGGFPNLKWNRNEIMNSFPPQPQTPVDSILPLDIHLSFLQPLSVTHGFTPSDFDYVVIVHWSRFMGRQSKRLIRTVQTNSRLKPQQKIKLVYVNNDDMFADPQDIK